MKELEHDLGIEFESNCISGVELELVRAKQRILEKLQARFGDAPQPAVKNIRVHASAIL